MVRSKKKILLELAVDLLEKTAIFLYAFRSKTFVLDREEPNKLDLASDLFLKPAIVSTPTPNQSQWLGRNSHIDLIFAMAAKICWNFQMRPRVA